MVFAEFLQDVHENEYPGTLSFEEWVEQMPATEWIGLGDKFADLKADLISVDLTELDEEYAKE